MKKLSKLLKISALALFCVLFITGDVFAAQLASCMGAGKKYPNLTTSANRTAPAGYTVFCTKATETNGTTTSTVYIYGKKSADCTQAAAIVSNPDNCNTEDLSTTIQTIINTVIFAVGMIAVVMIILGGISYATSQGDPNKVNKAKSTIMYGIIGLVVCLLAFAIVNFVLQALAG